MAITRPFSTLASAIACLTGLGAVGFEPQRSDAPPQLSSPFAGALQSRTNGVVELKGSAPFAVHDLRVEQPGQLPRLAEVPSKRFVLRYSESGWNGSLVIGAHGGSGGNNYDATGKVIGTDETALDDVIGRHAVARGFAYASVDRDGAMSPQQGFSLTKTFASQAAAEVTARLGRAPSRTYLLGLSMGGGIARVAAESETSGFAGIVIVAGAGGDQIVRTERQERIARLWPDVDPKTRHGMPDTNPRVRAFAAAIGTPVAARRLWPYTATNMVNAAKRPAAAPGPDSSGRPKVPTIEVAGTWDDFVLPELEMYRRRVNPPSLHRLYLVDGVWHMSGDDDGVQSFMYVASRTGLDPDVAKAMSEGPSYLPTVREAFDRLVAWVERGIPAPPSQTVTPGESLREVVAGRR